MTFHEWTNEQGEVLILRRIPQSRITNGDGEGEDFVWPSGVGSVVECPDWRPDSKCGGGLHGWPLGFGLGEGCDYDIIEDIWLVIGATPEDVCGELEGNAKCKFRVGVIRFEGTFGAAMEFVRSGFAACVKAMSKEKNGDLGKSTVAGDDGKSTVAGNHGQSTVVGDWGRSTVAGDWGKSTVAGNHGQSTVAGDLGQSTVVGNWGRSTVAGNLGRSTVAGDWGKSTVAGNHGQSTVAGNCGRSTVAGDYATCEALGVNCVAAIAGTGRVRVGERGAFAIAYYTDVDGWRFLTGKVGEKCIWDEATRQIVEAEANVWYVVRDGKLAREKL